jgi:hypothetical protein
MSECTSSLETESQRPSLSSWGEGNMTRRKLTEAARHSGGVTAAARWQGCAKQLEKPSSPRREIGGERNRITGDTGKSVEGERVAERSAVATKSGNADGAKGPCCLQRL